MTNKISLYDALLPVLPKNVTPIVKTSIEAFEALPGLRNWRPEKIEFGTAIQILRYGLPLSFLSPFDSLDPLRKRIAQAILNNESPGSSDLSELNAAALCVALDAIWIENVKRSHTKTPDFSVSWRMGEKVDLEVTCGRKKQAHIEKQNIATELAHQILASDGNWDVILHFIDIPNLHEIQVIAETARKLRPGVVIEEPGRWCIRAEQPNRDPNTLITGGQQDKVPEWWPSSTVNSLVFYGSVAGPNATEPPPQARVTFGVPLVAYINPVEHKASRPQSKQDKPFVIAIDAHKMPGAFRTFRQDLPTYFSIWQHISAVLAFQSFIGLEKVGWRWELFSNPHANYPLPQELSARRLVEDQPLETYVLLQEAETK